MVVRFKQSLYFFLFISTLTVQFLPDKRWTAAILLFPECDGAAQHRGRSADGAGPLLTSLTHFPLTRTRPNFLFGPLNGFPREQRGSSSKTLAASFVSAEEWAWSRTDWRCKALSPNATLSCLSAVYWTPASLNTQQERRGKQTNVNANVFDVRESYCCNNIPSTSFRKYLLYITVLTAIRFGDPEKWCYCLNATISLQPPPPPVHQTPTAPAPSTVDQKVHRW